MKKRSEAGLLDLWLGVQKSRRELEVKRVSLVRRTFELVRSRTITPSEAEEIIREGFRNGQEVAGLFGAA